ncbi:hypothetical protein L2E82_25386 [Cichorium intybus]|uniref:Uncharacterized protein n=1 Tax=Cichorium intybus TaxID=13427 RepID=A0ACB9E3S1_CICIN|nr:hypothetical protein L2E82_25386 [Cichorium intybus]
MRSTTWASSDGVLVRLIAVLTKLHTMAVAAMYCGDVGGGGLTDDGGVGTSGMGVNEWTHQKQWGRSRISDEVCSLGSRSSDGGDRDFVVYVSTERTI